MNLRAIFSTSVLFLSGCLLNAAPVITMNTSFPEDYRIENAFAINTTSDKGFIIGGASSDHFGNRYGLLMKTDSLGHRTGKQFLFPGNYMEVIGLVETHDSAYVTLAKFFNLEKGSDWKVVKTSGTGNKIWARTLGYSGHDSPRSIIKTRDSGFVVAGFTSKTYDDTISSLVKLDKNGAVVWYRSYASNRSVIQSVKQTVDGGFILAGGVRGTTAWHGGLDAYLLKVDSLGVQQWCQVYGENGDEIGNSVDIADDGGYVLAGSSTSFGNGLEDALIVKTDSTGKYIWHKTFGGSGSDIANAIICHQLGTFTFAANMRSFSSDSCAAVYQLSSTGDSIGFVKMSGTFESNGNPLAALDEIGFALCYTNEGIINLAVSSENNKPVAYWNFENITDNVATDISGNGHHAIISGTGVTLSPGKIGNAINLSGNNFEIIASNTRSDFDVPIYSIEAWLHTNVAPNTYSNEEIYTQMILDFSSIAPSVRNGFSTQIRVQGKALLGESSNIGGYWENLFSGTTLAQHTWYHLVFTNDGEDLNVYINGVKNAMTANGSVGKFVSPNKDARIGCQSMSSGTVRNFFNGMIDELKFYNKALTPVEVLSHFNAK